MLYAIEINIFILEIFIKIHGIYMQKILLTNICKLLHSNLFSKNKTVSGRFSSCTQNHSYNAFIVTQITEKHSEFNKEMNMAFTDLEKAFDRVNRNIL